MKSLPTVLSASLVTLSLLLPACANLGAGTAPAGSGTGISLAQAQAGAEYLQSSVASLQAALDAAKANGDPEKVKQAEAVLAQAKAATDAFKASIGTGAATDKWDVARSMLTTATAVLAPIAVQALVSGS